MDVSEAEGFEYGASQEEVDAAIEGLEPITLTFQPATVLRVAVDDLE